MYNYKIFRLLLQLVLILKLKHTQLVSNSYSPNKPLIHTVQFSSIVYREVNATEMPTQMKNKHNITKY